MIKKIIGIAICIMAIRQAEAQGFSVELGGGLQGMRYTLPNGQSKIQPGGSLGLGYSFTLSSNVDLLTGISGGLYRSQATLQDGVVYSSYQVDDQGSAFQYSVKPTGYKETQQFFAASVPLMLQYHTTNEGIQWYIDGGAKVFLPFGSSVQVSAKQLTLSGYYPDYNIAVSNLPQHGFGTINNWSSNATTKLKPSAAISAATGISLSVAPGMRFYAGLYIDYGLTSMKGKNDSMQLASYSSAGISGVQAGGVLNMAHTGQVSLLAFGVQFKLSFGTSKSRSGAKAQKETQPAAKDSLSEEQYAAIEGPVVFGHIDESTIPDNQKDHLDEVAALMKQYPTIRISIVGHVCDNETEAEDKKVGGDRAKAVAAYLRAKGVDPGRMEVSPTSESDAFEPFDPLANFRNRKAVITVLNKK